MIQENLTLPASLEKIFQKEWRYASDNKCIVDLAIINPNEKRVLISVIFSIPKKDDSAKDSDLTYMQVVRDQYGMNDVKKNNDTEMGLLWMERQCRKALLVGFYNKNYREDVFLQTPIIKTIKVELDVNRLTEIKGLDMKNYFDEYKPKE